MSKRLIGLLLVLMTMPAAAQEKRFSLSVPPEISDTGFLQHLLPRFSLKTGVRISLDDAQALARIGGSGTPIFQQDQRIWYFDAPPGPHTDAFLDWLLSDVGKRTIEAFAPNGTALFSADVTAEAPKEVAQISGDVVAGQKLSLEHCGRCHVVDAEKRMNAIGSTPSFMLMRTFPDWLERFQTFFYLKPHAAFTQVTDVTEPFAENLPSPIVPIEVSLEDIDAIAAYVGTVAPADLGAEIKSQ